MSSPRLVMTVCVRDEQDIIRVFVDYHLGAGVDHILVRTGSTDLSQQILAGYRASGRVSVTEAPSEAFDQSAWASEMGERAYREHGAEFVLHADSDELWRVLVAPPRGLEGSVRGRAAARSRRRRGTRQLPALPGGGRALVGAVDRAGGT